MTGSLFFTNEMLEDAIDPGWLARQGDTVHVTFPFSETVWMRVNGVPVPEPPDRGYNPDALVVLKDGEDKRGD